MTPKCAVQFRVGPAVRPPRSTVTRRDSPGAGTAAPAGLGRRPKLPITRGATTAHLKVFGGVFSRRSVRRRRGPPAACTGIHEAELPAGGDWRPGRPWSQPSASGRGRCSAAGAELSASSSASPPLTGGEPARRPRPQGSARTADRSRRHPSGAGPAEAFAVPWWRVRSAGPVPASQPVGPVHGPGASDAIGQRSGAPTHEAGRRFHSVLRNRPPRAGAGAGPVTAEGGRSPAGRRSPDRAMAARTARVSSGSKKALASGIKLGLR